MCSFKLTITIITRLKHKFGSIANRYHKSLHTCGINFNNRKYKKQLKVLSKS